MKELKRNKWDVCHLPKEIYEWLLKEVAFIQRCSSKQMWFTAREN